MRDSGLDGVDLLASHGELLTEFLSPVLNNRKDRYGGSLEGRMKLIYEVIQRVREYVSSDIAVGMRLLGEEKYEGGNKPSDTAEIARWLDGKLDWVSTDLGFSPQDDDWQAVPMYVESGYTLKKYSSLIRAAIKKTKLGVVGRYVDPYSAERLIAEGQADMVAMTRALIADPELPNKSKRWENRGHPSVHRGISRLLGKDDSGVYPCLAP